MLYKGKAIKFCARHDKPAEYMVQRSFWYRKDDGYGQAVGTSVSSRFWNFLAFKSVLMTC